MFDPCELVPTDRGKVRLNVRLFASTDPASYSYTHRCFKGAGMVQRRQRERSLFEVLLPDGHKLWPDWLRKIDTLLEDEAVTEVVAQALERRFPQSRRRGRLGTPAEVVIRLLILKHLFNWSYDDLEHEVRANVVYRMFTRIDAGEVPDAKTILKN